MKGEVGSPLRVEAFIHIKSVWMAQLYSEVVVAAAVHFVHFSLNICTYSMVLVKLSGVKRVAVVVWPFERIFHFNLPKLENSTADVPESYRTSEVIVFFWIDPSKGLDIHHLKAAIFSQTEWKLYEKCHILPVSFSLQKLFKSLVRSLLSAAWWKCWPPSFQGRILEMTWWLIKPLLLNLV